MNALNLPDIDGKPWKPVMPGQSEEGSSADGEDEFNFEDIPFKADYMYDSEAPVKKLLQEGAKVLGVPAASLSWGIDGNRAIPALTAGKEGEKQTAKLLDKLAAEFPEMFVFHSLSWPESAGDTDHIVVYGNLVLVIDTKRWKSSRKYSVTAKGGILRGTVPFPEGKVKIGWALKAWRQKLPGKPKVQGVVTIAQEKVFVVRDKNWYQAPFRLVENEKLEEFLRETFQKNPPQPVSAKLLLFLGSLLVKERRRIEEIIRYGGEYRSNDLK